MKQSNIPSLCDAIVNHLTLLGIPTAESLLPGASENRIREMTADLPFVLPQSAIELYKWSEGVRIDCDTCSEIFPGYGMDSLQDMMQTYRELRNHSEFTRFHCDDIQWFPIFRSSGTDFFAIRCRDFATEDSEIFDDDNEGEHRLGAIPPAVEFISLEAMLQTILMAYETGVYFIGEGGILDYGIASYFEDGPYKGCLKEVDISRFKEVARRFNPGLACWE